MGTSAAVYAALRAATGISRYVRVSVRRAQAKRMILARRGRRSRYALPMLLGTDDGLWSF